jgi:hypothetical protein
MYCESCGASLSYNPFHVPAHLHGPSWPFCTFHQKDMFHEKLAEVDRMLSKPVQASSIARKIIVEYEKETGEAFIE